MSYALHDLFSHHLDRAEGPIPFDKAELPTHGGVYALTGLDNNIIQLAAGEQLRRLLTCRLYPPNDPQKRPRADLLAVTERVWWEPSFSQFETALKYHEIARRIYPKQYRKMCAFAPAWFAVVNLQDRFPRWLTSSDPFCGRSACVGPFNTRGRCDTFVKHLEDLFSLCRYHHVLEQSPDGEACAYFEMGRCPAPCDGTIPFDQYRQMLSDSVAFVLGGAREHAESLEEGMRAAADAQRFELANRLKQEHACAEQLQDMMSRRHKNVAEFQYLTVQRGGGRTRFKAFFVNRGEISASDTVHAKALAETVPLWLERLRNLPEPRLDDPTAAVERIWLACHFLSKQSRLPGVWLHRDQLSDATTFTARIKQAFAPQRKAGPK